jgi:glutamine synthetase
MTEAEREAVGVTQRMPMSWEEARAALAEDEALKGILGDLVDGFLAVGETLDGLLHSPTSEAERVQMLIEYY